MRTLTTEELGKLYQVFSLDETLMVIDDEFNKCFIKSDHFRVGCSICILLQDQLLTKAQVRINNCFIDLLIFKLWRSYRLESMVFHLMNVVPVSSPANFGIFNSMRLISRRAFGSKSFHAVLFGFCRTEYRLVWKEIFSRTSMFNAIKPRGDRMAHDFDWFAERG